MIRRERTDGGQFCNVQRYFKVGITDSHNPTLNIEFNIAVCFSKLKWLHIVLNMSMFQQPSFKFYFSIRCTLLSFLHKAWEIFNGFLYVGWITCELNPRKTVAWYLDLMTWLFLIFMHFFTINRGWSEFHLMSYRVNYKPQTFRIKYFNWNFPVSPRI